ncbi:hypothetical protein OROHE_025723 [Orobanche hederae]
MFRSCDEADIFYALYRIGCLFIQEVSQELEPSFDGKLGFNNSCVVCASHLSASRVSLERKTSTADIFLCGYTLILGRISRGLVDVVDQSTLLTSLSAASRFTFTSTSEKFEVTRVWSTCVKSNEVSSVSPETMGPKKSTAFLELHFINAMSCMEIIFQKIVDLWPLIQLGCMNEVARTLLRVGKTR